MDTTIFGKEAEKKIQQYVIEQRAEMTAELNTPEGKAKILPKEIYGKFAGVDIRNKYTRYQLEASERLEGISANKQLRTKSVQDYLEQIEKSHAFHKFDKDIKSRSITAAINWLTGDKIQQELPEAGASLKNIADRYDKSFYKTDYQKTLQVMEYLSGDNKGPIPADIKEFCEKKLECPIPKDVIKEHGLRRSGISLMGIHFQSDEARDELENGDKEGVELDYAGDYCAASARRTLKALYEPYCEKMDMSESDRNLLIYLRNENGQWVDLNKLAARETSKRYGNQFSTERVNRVAEEILGAAAMNGQRVIGYAPDGKTDKLSPVVFSGEGYEPTPVKPVHLNRWERHFNKYGFYEKKAEAAARYEKYQARQQQLTTDLERELDEISDGIKTKIRDLNNGVDFANTVEKDPKLKETFDFYRSYQKEKNALRYDLAVQMFGVENTTKYGGTGLGDPANNCYRLERAGITRGAALLLNDGHSIDDIMNPDMLKEEKAAAGKTLLEMQRRNDPKEYAEAMRPALERFMEEGAKVTITSRQDMRNQCGKLELLSFCHDIWQEINAFPQVKEAFEDTFLQEGKTKEDAKSFLDNLNRVYNPIADLTTVAENLSYKGGPTALTADLERERLVYQELSKTEGNKIVNLNTEKGKLVSYLAAETLINTLSHASPEEKMTALKLAVAEKPLTEDRTRLVVKNGKEVEYPDRGITTELKDAFEAVAAKSKGAAKAK